MREHSLIALGAIAGVHGVKGDVRIKCFTEDPLDIAAYGPLSSEDGTRIFIIKNVRPSKGDQIIARIDGIHDRGIAMSLKGTRLYVTRDKLPALEEESWYHTDLIGLKVELSCGTECGEVVALHDFGAGDLIEIKKGDGKNLLVPFTKKAVPVIDLEKGRVVIDPPEEISAQDQGEEQ